MKYWYQSATLWTNLLAVVSACGTYFTGAASLYEAAPAVFLALLNIVLRFKTKVPVRLGPPAL